MFRASHAIQFAFLDFFGRYFSFITNFIYFWHLSGFLLFTCCLFIDFCIYLHSFFPNCMFSPIFYQQLILSYICSFPPLIIAVIDAFINRNTLLESNKNGVNYKTQFIHLQNTRSLQISDISLNKKITKQSLLTLSSADPWPNNAGLLNPA